MSDIIERMRASILKVSDPNNPYTQADFDVEFAEHYNHTPFTQNQVSEIKFDENFYKIKLKFVNKSDNPNPEYATNGSSGFDLRANLLDGPVIIPSGEVIVVPTGLYFDIPENFEIQVRPRSGLAAKNAVTVLNTPGTVDSDYTGEVKVILINHGKTDFTVYHGDRIAQAIFASVLSKNFVNLTQVTDITKDTERGSGGFGSTGKN
jgi:dUTP pyrophosphatase